MIIQKLSVCGTDSITIVRYYMVSIGSSEVLAQVLDGTCTHGDTLLGKKNCFHIMNGVMYMTAHLTYVPWVFFNIYAWFNEYLSVHQYKIDLIYIVTITLFSVYEGYFAFVLKIVCAWLGGKKLIWVITPPQWSAADCGLSCLWNHRKTECGCFSLWDKKKRIIHIKNQLAGIEGGDLFMAGWTIWERRCLVWLITWHKTNILAWKTESLYPVVHDWGLWSPSRHPIQPGTSQ